jgi:hypothetical protein
MPATLRSIQGRVVELNVCLDPDKPEDERTEDDFFTVRYRQHNLTRKIADLAQDAEKDGRVFEALVKMCIPVFESWDLKPGATDEQMERLNAATTQAEIAKIEKEIREAVDAQEPIPITEDALSEFVPASVLVLILNQIQETRSPNQNGTGRL